MIATSHSTFVKTFISLLCAAALCGSVGAVRAADHGDAPNVAGDQAADLADLYFFLDPNDNSKAVIILTVRGFIVPGEAVNFAIFDQKVRFGSNSRILAMPYRTAFIDVTFDKRTADPGPPPRGKSSKYQERRPPRSDCQTTETFTAPVFNPSLGSSRRRSQSRLIPSAASAFLPAKSMIRSFSTFLLSGGLSHRCAMALPIPLYLIAHAILLPATTFWRSQCGFRFR